MSGWNESAWFSYFVGFALKGTAVLGVAWFLAWMLRRRSAAARHLVWTAAAAAIVALPLLTVSIPVLRVPAMVALLPETASLVFRTTATASSDAGAVRPPDATRSTKADSIVPARRTDWRLWLMLVWVAGAAITLAQMLVACAAVWRVRRAAKPLRNADGDLCNALAQSLGIRHRVDVLETETGSMPMTWGVLRSAIFMPSDAASWSEERRRIVLLHELAHVHRGDAVTQLLARTALTLYWWNPLAWKAWREFLKERERATDDLVLSFGARASDYAGHLLAVARSLKESQDLGWAAVAMARRSHLEGRLAAILDSAVNRKTPGRAWAFTAALLAVMIVVPLAAVRAQAPAQAPAQNDKKPAVPADVDAVIRSAVSQNNPEILENSAKAAEQLQKYDTAAQLLEPALEIRASAGKGSVNYGMGLLKLGDLDSLRDRNKSAEDFYTRAVQIVGDRPETGRALVFLGKSAIRTKDFSKATEYLERAKHADPAKAGVAVMWMAVARQREEKIGEADTLFQSALAQQDPKSQDAVTTMKVYAQFLRKQKRDDEAKGMEARATDAQHASAATPAAVAMSGVFKAGAGVAAPKLLQKVDPQYSEDARTAALQGSVVLSVVVGTDGLAHEIRVVQGIGLGLDQKAIDAINQWTFQPGVKDGQPVAVSANIEVNFRLL